LVPAGHGPVQAGSPRRCFSASRPEPPAPAPPGNLSRTAISAAAAHTPSIDAGWLCLAARNETGGHRTAAAGPKSHARPRPASR
jgi:hypothetical protein